MAFVKLRVDGECSNNDENLVYPDTLQTKASPLKKSTVRELAIDDLLWVRDGEQINIRCLPILYKIKLGVGLKNRDWGE